MILSEKFVFLHHKLTIKGDDDDEKSSIMVGWLSASVKQLRHL